MDSQFSIGRGHEFARTYHPRRRVYSASPTGLSWALVWPLPSAFDCSQHATYRTHPLWSHMGTVKKPLEPLESTLLSPAGVMDCLALFLVGSCERPSIPRLDGAFLCGDRHTIPNPLCLRAFKSTFSIRFHRAYSLVCCDFVPLRPRNKSALLGNFFSNV